MSQIVQVDQVWKHKHSGKRLIIKKVDGLRVTAWNADNELGGILFISIAFLHREWSLLK